MGGLNIYGVVRNELIGRIDYLGLSPDSPDCCKAEKRHYETRIDIYTLTYQNYTDAQKRFTDAKKALGSARTANDAAKAAVKRALALVATTTAAATTACELAKRRPSRKNGIACGLAVASMAVAAHK